MLALERELRFSLFVREKGRLTGLTPEGQEVVLRAESVLLDIDYIRGLGQSATIDQGALVIATTHTQARYVIPEALSRFAQRFPKVHVTLRHGNAEQIHQALEDGSADIGIAPDSELPTSTIAALECRRYRRIVLAPKDHPLSRRKRCSLKDLAQHPFVALEPAISTWQTVLQVFETAGFTLNIILSATDADVVNDCVGRGLGLAVLVDVAYDPMKDANIALLETGDLFPLSITSVAIHRRRHLLPFAFDFIEMFAPCWTRSKVEQAMARNATPSAATVQSSGAAERHPRIRDHGAHALADPGRR
ncbi:MAG: LysR substrate-binding domain-containing protein [Burkholderiales bacterium]